MSDYDFYYWPLPFRGQFIRAILAHAGKSWTEHGEDAISALMQADPGDQPVPFMGPPLLVDKRTGFALAEMPAIALYLGRALDLMPASAEGQAMTMRIVNDANDVIDEITLDGGREMWTPEKWRAFVPRLRRWMRFWEITGTRHGLEPDTGFVLGGTAPGIADIATATLWSTMRDRFPVIGEMLDDAAPRIAALCRRMSDLPALAALARRSDDLYGDGYCGGEIEASLRTVAGG
ncbi:MULTISPECIES: glutathione S-transferase [unclassified Sphingomonas]|uniref:glutathione S-transferase n=1 Tax=unclassified Sphingomonas TaxID=196159 RepID=UPI0006F9A4A6|nr:MULTISPECIES: glutathione S-transferase [unclassified Sphingomonas]KQX25445.1 glutathione S-transferase [Sphingomonas sp. Root1294]KQY66437.1 glutathione S-transferase [Sphingomonas sp. Root50]KRB90246.1 glutathione S-transferase [Sphingomonas sp. Root720]